VARFIPEELAERAARVLHPWSRTTPAERRQARQLLREYERHRTNARVRRVALHDERLVEEDPL
jgi:hypothetical protein